MYVCKKCGNKKYFNEMNYEQTFVVLDEETGEIQFTQDSHVGCAEVFCGKCKSSSEDGDILDRNTKEPIVISE